MASCNTEMSRMAMAKLNKFNRAVSNRISCDVPTLVAVFEYTSETPIMNMIFRRDFKAVKPAGRWEIECESVREFILKSY